MPTLAAHGARTLVRSEDALSLEGGWSPRRLVVHEFADRAAALAWYHSPEYQHAAALRHRSATSRIVISDGAPPPA